MTRQNTLTRPARLRRPVALIAASLLVAAVSSGCGSETGKADAKTGGGPEAVAISEPWVRATQGSKDPSMTAAFMALDNTTDDPVTITGVESDVAGMVQLHDMVEKDGAMVMQEVPDGIVLAPHTGVLLQPGGKHVMLMDMKRDLAPGDEVTFTVNWSGGGSETITAPVKEAAEEEGHYHEPGTGEHTHE